MKKWIFRLLFLLLIILAGCEMSSESSTEVVKPLEDIRLAAPVLVIKDQMLTWNQIENAEYYVVYADDEIVMVGSDTSFDLSKYKDGTFKFSVQAKSHKVNVLPSSIVTISYQVNLDTSKFSVLMINDTHGAFVDGEYAGISRVASIVASLEDENLIKVANGDIFQGSYASNVLYGRPLIDALNMMEFDCFVIGNHDFDWGLDVIHQYKDGDPENGEALFPFLGANIMDKATGEMVDWLEPYTICEFGDLKVGIIGLIGYNLESSILAEMVADYEFIYPLNLVSNYASTLRTEEGCDYVIVSIHDYDEELNKRMAALSGDHAIDGILCGHTHQNVTQVLSNGNNEAIPVVQNQDKNKAATLITYNTVNHTYQSQRLLPKNYSIDSEVYQLELAYKDYIDEGNRELGICPYLSKSTLGHYATDILASTFNADIGIINTGGIRASLSSGTFTVSDVFDVFPFNNEVITVRLTGRDVINLYNEHEDYLYFNTSFNISNIDRDSSYLIAVIDYVFTGPYYTQFQNVEFTDTDILMRDLMIQYLDQLY